MSGLMHRSTLRRLHGMFQSRHRDACHFRQIDDSIRRNTPKFQSRNRDAFHFRVLPRVNTNHRLHCFNLAIEMLFISGPTKRIQHYLTAIASFNLAIEMLFMSGACAPRRCGGTTDVSISQSRCFSFQVSNPDERHSRHGRLFQSRNREAFHVRF